MAAINQPARASRGYRGPGGQLWRATRGWRGPAAAELEPTLLLAVLAPTLLLADVDAGISLADVSAGLVLADVESAALLVADIEQTVAVATLSPTLALAEVEPSPIITAAVSGGQIINQGLTLLTVEIEDMSVISSVNEWVTKKGDTRHLKATIKEKPIGAEDTDATAVNLTGATVTFNHEAVDGSDPQVETVTITNATGGEVQVEWAVGRLDTAGSRRGEFKITLADGQGLTSPSDGAVKIRVIDDYQAAGIEGCF